MCGVGFRHLILCFVLKKKMIGFFEMHCDIIKNMLKVFKEFPIEIELNSEQLKFVKFWANETEIKVGNRFLTGNVNQNNAFLSIRLYCTHVRKCVW